MGSTFARIQLVVLDWAGTTVDHGCFAPVRPFVEALADAGITLSDEDARKPMGLEKRDHLRELLQLDAVADQWQAKHGRPWDEKDLDALYHDGFVPRQLACVRDNCQLITGLMGVVDELRNRGIKIGTTTGYFPEAAELAYEAARQQGYHPDFNVHGGSVPSGRPAPWMIFRIMEQAGVFPPHAVVKIGDTIPDILEGRNAGVWSVGVTDSSSDAAKTEQAWRETHAAEKERIRSSCREQLTLHGAHAVIRTVADALTVINEINERLAEGAKP